MYRSRIPPLAVALLVACTGCSGSDAVDTDAVDIDTDAPATVPAADPWVASGTAQKGPFLEGAMVTAEAREGATGDASAPVTGVVDARGRYDLGELPWGGPTTLVVEGAWFHEIDAEPADEPLRLRAVVFAEGALAVNANLLTHLHAGRVDVLVQGGTPFLEAVQQAQADLQALTAVEREPWSLDYFAGGTDPSDGALLQLSAAFASDDLTQLELDIIASDFADDGQVNTFGASTWASLIEEASDEDLLEDALEGLAEGYPAETPVVVPDPLLLGLSSNGCNPVGNDEICPDGSASLPLDGGSATFTLKPTVPGHYVAVAYHPFCAAASATSSLGGGSDGTTGTLIQSFLPGVIEEGDEITYTVSVGCGATDVDVDFYRFADGSPESPLWFPPQGRFNALYGSTPSTHLSSWYAMPLSAVAVIPGVTIDVADLRLVSSLTTVRISVYDPQDTTTPLRVEECSVPCAVDHRTGIDGSHALIEVQNAGPLETAGAALFEVD